MKWLVIVHPTQFDDGKTMFAADDAALDKIVSSVAARHQPCTAYLIGERREYSFKLIPTVETKL